VFHGQDHAAVQLRACLAALAEKYQAEPDTLLLAWLLALPAQVLPVLGTTDIERLKRQLHASKLQLERQDWFTILEAAEGREVP
jgi:predicted oxidoreductase